MITKYLFLSLLILLDSCIDSPPKTDRNSINSGELRSHPVYTDTNSPSNQSIDSSQVVSAATFHIENVKYRIVDSFLLMPFPESNWLQINDSIPIFSETRILTLTSISFESKTEPSGTEYKHQENWIRVSKNDKITGYYLNNKIPSLRKPWAWGMSINTIIDIYFLDSSDVASYIGRQFPQHGSNTEFINATISKIKSIMLSKKDLIIDDGCSTYKLIFTDDKLSGISLETHAC